MSTKRTQIRSTYSPPIQVTNNFRDLITTEPAALSLNSSQACQSPEEVRLQSLNYEIQELREELQELEDLEDACASWDSYERPRLKYQIILCENERSTLVRDHHYAALKRLREELSAFAQVQESAALLMQSCAPCATTKAKKAKHGTRKRRRRGIVASLVAIVHILRICRLPFH